MSKQIQKSLHECLSKIKISNKQIQHQLHLRGRKKPKTPSFVSTNKEKQNDAVTQDPQNAATHEALNAVTLSDIDKFLFENSVCMPAKFTHNKSMTANKHSDIQQPLISELHPPQPQYVIVLPPYPAPHRHRLFRKSVQRCLFCAATFLLFLIAAAYLLWPSHPELSVVRLRLDRLHINTRSKASIDVTLDLTVRIRNRDFYSMDYNSLLVAIGYRGKQLGFVTSDGGYIKAREASYVNATLQLERVEVLTDVILLIEDLARGAITFDMETEIDGKLDVFYFDLPLKTKMKCEVIVNTTVKTISSQSCYSEVSEVR